MDSHEDRADPHEMIPGEQHQCLWSNASIVKREQPMHTPASPFLAIGQGIEYPHDSDGSKARVVRAA